MAEAAGRSLSVQTQAWLGEQVGESEPFICELLESLRNTIQDLEQHQIHMFYETVGLMISADTDAPRRDQYLVRGIPCLVPCCWPLAEVFLPRQPWCPV